MPDKIQATSQVKTTTTTQQTQKQQAQATNPYMSSVFNMYGSMDTGMMMNGIGNMYSGVNMMNPSSPFTDLQLPNNMQSWMSALANCFNFDFSKVDFSQYSGNNMMMGGNYNFPSFGGLTIPGSAPNGGSQQVVNVSSLTAEHKIIVSELQALGVTSTGDLEKDKAALEKAKKADGAKKQEASDICNGLYDAMKGIGTKNDKLKEFVSKINKDNVLEVMNIWNENFASDMDGESLIESICNECYGGWFSNQQKDLTTHIQKALKAKSEELGLKSEASAFDAKVTSENNRWWNTRDSVVVGHFNDMYAKAANAENEEKAKKVVIAQNTPIPAAKKEKE